MKLEELIAEVERLDKEATPAPWRYDDGITDEQQEPPERGKAQLLHGPDSWPLGEIWSALADDPKGGASPEESDANGRFIAFSRTALPQLAALCREQKREIERLRAGIALAKSMLYRNEFDESEPHDGSHARVCDTCRVVDYLNQALHPKKESDHDP